MMFTVTACGNAQLEEPVADDTMKVALVVPGPVNDGGWCAVAYQGHDVVIGHGFQFGDPALKVGAKYPDT